MPRPYTYLGKYPAQNKLFGIYGVSEREKQSDDISKVGEYEICIPKPRILVQGILCRHGRENTKAIKEYVANQLQADKEGDQLSMFDTDAPFKGSK